MSSAQRISSPPPLHAWFLILLILLTMGFFLFIVISTSNRENLDPASISKEFSIKSENIDERPETTMESMALYTGDDLVSNTDLMRMIQKYIRVYLHGMETELSTDKLLGGKNVVSVRVDKTGFYVYDINASYDPGQGVFIVSVLMELPKISVVLSDPYSRYYPDINPYIHAVEITFSMDTKSLKMRSIQLFMVDWIVNRYNTMYIQTKNSPICLRDMPPPMDLSSEELHEFITSLHLFSEIPIPDNELHTRPATDVSHIKRPQSCRIDSLV